jgi:hypothetical protein
MIGKVAQALFWHQHSKHDTITHALEMGCARLVRGQKYPYTLPLIISITRKKVLLVVPVYSFVDKCQTHATPHEET